MTVTVRLSAEDKELFKRHATAKQLTMSELLRNAVMEQIEDEIDVNDYYDAMEEFKANPITYTHDYVFGKAEEVD